MSQQPEALRLAESLDELDAQFTYRGMCGDAAAELRRLHAENEALKAAVAEAVAAERDACAALVAEWNTAMTDRLAASIRARGAA